MELLILIFFTFAILRLKPHPQNENNSYFRTDKESNFKGSLSETETILTRVFLAFSSPPSAS